MMTGVYERRRTIRKPPPARTAVTTAKAITAAPATTACLKDLPMYHRGTRALERRGLKRVLAPRRRDDWRCTLPCSRVRVERRRHDGAARRTRVLRLRIPRQQ